ncbi:MAG: protein kinase, partial [Polyangia bacterium]|nr:protein kinase [Polyangia bacterium]
MTTVPLDLGRYRCTEKLGEDALSEVFRAEIKGEEGFKKVYTLKRFRPEAEALPGFLPRITKDALRNAELEYGGVVRILGFERIGETHVLVSEYVDGISLRDLLDRLLESNDAVPWNVAAHIAIEVAKSLDYTHGAPSKGPGAGGLVHGALCPRHIMLTWEGAVRVIHFGLAPTLEEARAKLAGPDLQSRAYRSPEQLALRPARPQSDLFALGTILYEMVAGRPLFEISPDGSRVMSAAPGRAQAEGAALLKPVLKKLLAPGVADRFAEAEDVVMELQRLLVSRGQAVSVTPLVVWLEQVTRAISPASADDFEEEEATTVHATEDFLPNYVPKATGPKPPLASGPQPAKVVLAQPDPLPTPGGAPAGTAPLAQRPAITPAPAPAPAMTAQALATASPATLAPLSTQRAQATASPATLAPKPEPGSTPMPQAMPSPVPPAPWPDMAPAMSSPATPASAPASTWPAPSTPSPATPAQTPGMSSAAYAAPNPWGAPSPPEDDFDVSMDDSSTRGSTKALRVALVCVALWALAATIIAAYLYFSGSRGAQSQEGAEPRCPKVESPGKAGNPGPDVDSRPSRTEPRSSISPGGMDARSGSGASLASGADTHPREAEPSREVPAQHGETARASAAPGDPEPLVAAGEPGAGEMNLVSA